MEVKEKTVVSMHYTGKLSDGSVFDSSEGREPLSFLCGAQNIIPGLEKEILGMKQGEKKTITVHSTEAYGPRDEAALQEVPKDQFPADIQLEKGMQLAAQGPQGVIPIVIEEIKDDSVVVDFNHPLAGKDLTFEVEVVDVREATEDEMQHGHAHGEGDEHHH